jgi:uncharacterized protein YbaR (Trm112 family)
MENIVEYVVCPIDKAPLANRKEFWECTKCGTKFKVTNGIPNLIPEEAEIKPK